MDIRSVTGPAACRSYSGLHVHLPRRSSDSLLRQRGQRLLRRCVDMSMLPLTICAYIYILRNRERERDSVCKKRKRNA